MTLLLSKTFCISRWNLCDWIRFLNFQNCLWEFLSKILRYEKLAEKNAFALNYYIWEFDLKKKLIWGCVEDEKLFVYEEIKYLYTKTKWMLPNLQGCIRTGSHFRSDDHTWIDTINTYILCSKFNCTSPCKLIQSRFTGAVRVKSRLLRNKFLKLISSYTQSRNLAEEKNNIGAVPFIW